MRKSNKNKVFPILSSSVLFLILSLFSCLSVSAPDTETKTKAETKTEAETNKIRFDHLSTSFRLSIAHQNVECTRCHVRGIFKSTPKECRSCHASSSVITAFGKDADHIISTDECEVCHGENGTSWSSLNIRNHDGVIGNQCEGCHNGRFAEGKHSRHIPSNNVCDDCHSTGGSFAGARFDHNGITTGCVRCHNGVNAQGKHAAHIPSPNNCEICHFNFRSWKPAFVP